MSYRERNVLPIGNSTWTCRTLQVFDLSLFLCLCFLIFFIFFYFSYYLVIFLISSFLFSSYASVILRIFAPTLRFLFLSPLIMKKEAVNCCFCCWFRCCSNKYNNYLLVIRPVTFVRKYANSEMQALRVLKI